MAVEGAGAGAPVAADEAESAGVDGAVRARVRPPSRRTRPRATCRGRPLPCRPRVRRLARARPPHEAVTGAASASSVSGSPGLLSRKQRPRRCPHTRRCARIVPPRPGYRTLTEAIDAFARPADAVLVDRAADPAILPLADHCHIVAAPRPPPTGMDGASTYQCATHNGCERRPNHDVLRIEPRQKWLPE